MEGVYNLNRIAIIGTSGSGKTFLGSKLAAALNIKFVDLDDLKWLPNWEQLPDDAFFATIESQISCESWIVSGNYNRARSHIWPHAD